MLQPGQTLGTFTIQNELNPGRGAFGNAYKVIDSSTSSLAVLKVCKNPIGTIEANRFIQEVAILRKLSPHVRIIKPLTDLVDTDPNCIYYVMEMADTDLKDYLISPTSLPDETQKINIFKNICEGLKHAHSNRVIHRDLHWSNVLLKNESGVDEPKLSDFGKAKDFDASTSLTSPNIEWGGYVCPPEIIFQIWDPVPDDYCRGDIYALGLILHLIMVATPFLYPAAVKATIGSFLRTNKIQDFDSLTTAEKNNLYEQWLATTDLSGLLSYLNILTPDVKLNAFFAKIIPKLSHPDYRQRYTNIDEVLLDLNTI